MVIIYTKITILIQHSKEETLKTVHKKLFIVTNKTITTNLNPNIVQFIH